MTGRALAVLLLLAMSPAHARSLVDTLAEGTRYVTLEGQHAVHDDNSGFDTEGLAELTVGNEYDDWLGVEGRVAVDVRQMVSLVFFQDDDGSNTANIHVSGPPDEGSGLAFGAGLYVRASAHLNDYFGLYAVAGVDYASFRTRRCDVAATVCESRYDDRNLGAYGAGARWQAVEGVWLGAEARRLQGEGISMTVYGLNVGYTF
jgi:opacity protein-like surface antigen